MQYRNHDAGAYSSASARSTCWEQAARAQRSRSAIGSGSVSSSPASQAMNFPVGFGRAVRSGTEAPNL